MLVCKYIYARDPSTVFKPENSNKASALAHSTRLKNELAKKGLLEAFDKEIKKKQELGVLKKLTKENFPSDLVDPAILLCSAANNVEQRKQAQQTTVAIYLAFGFERIYTITSAYDPRQ